jgi:hypothetical protein
MCTHSIHWNVERVAEAGVSSSQCIVLPHRWPVQLLAIATSRPLESPVEPTACRQHSNDVIAQLAVSHLEHSIDLAYIVQVLRLIE